MTRMASNSVSHSTALWLAIGFALAAPAAAAQAPIKGDAQRGEQAYALRCSACHSPDSNRVGPAHRGVYGRRAGTAAGYSYSAALKRTGVVWNEANLDRWLAGPTKFAPGTKMGVSVTKAQDRADLIAYLKTLRAPAP